MRESKNNRNELFDDTCWVYVQQEDEDIYTIGLTYDEDFRSKETAAGRTPLLWRKFEDTLVAAGYRIVLQRIPKHYFRKILMQKIN